MKKRILLGLIGMLFVLVGMQFAAGAYVRCTTAKTLEICSDSGCKITSFPSTAKCPDKMQSGVIYDWYTASDLKDKKDYTCDSSGYCWKSTTTSSGTTSNPSSTTASSSTSASSSGDPAKGDTQFSDGKTYIFYDGKWYETVTSGASGVAGNPGDKQENANGYAIKGKDGKWYVVKKTTVGTDFVPDPVSLTKTIEKNLKSDADFTYGKKDEQTGLTPVKGMDGLYVKDVKGDGVPDDNQVYDKNWNAIGSRKDKEITLYGSNLHVDSKGKVYDSSDKYLGIGFKVTENAGGGAKYYYTADKKTVVYDKEGKVLTKDGEVFANGAYIDKSDKKKVFYNRNGAAIAGAVSDGYGGYYLDEKQKDGTSVTMHHYLDGNVYGEKGFFDTKYYFGKEDNKGGTVVQRTYDRCIDALSGNKGPVCQTEDGSTVYGFSGQVLEDAEYKNMFKDTFGIGSFGMTHFGNAVDTWVGLTSNRYFSLFYSSDETEIYKTLKENEFIGAVLGGIEGISGALCEGPVIDIDTSSASFSPNGGSAYAHIEAERVDYLNYSEGAEPTIRYQYLFTMDVNVAGCRDDTSVTTWILGQSESGVTV
ncbi:hypothetical protein COT47_06480, partial [Candidatus Woesearchaeota archaeon CG08_land_8_20_14_0_20_43_7]